MPNTEEARLSWAKTQLFKILPFVLPDFKNLSKEKQVKLTEALAEKPDVFAQVLAINVKDWDKFPVEKKKKIMSAIYSPEQIEELEKWPWFDPVFALSAPVGFGIKDIARQAIRAGAKAALKETGRTAGAVGSSLLAEVGTTAVAEPLEEKHPVLASILAPLVGVGVGVAAEKGTRALFKAAKKPVKPKLEEEVEKVEEILKPEIKESEILKEEPKAVKEPEIAEEAKLVEEPKVLEEKSKKVLKVEKGLVPDLEEITKGVKEAEEIVKAKPEIEPKVEKEIQAREQELEVEKLTKEDFDKALEEIKKITPSLEKQKLPEDLEIIEVQLTGSRARGEARPISDVDYFVYVNKNLNPWQESFLMHTLADKLSKKEVKLYTPDRAGIVDVKIVQPRHERWQVMQALKKGEPVSEEVLEYYPDLVEKYKFVKTEPEIKPGIKPETELKAGIKEKSLQEKEPWKMTKKEWEKAFGFPKISEKRAKEIDRMFYHGELWKVPLKDYLGFRFKEAGKKITFADLGVIGKSPVPTPKEIESAKEFHKGIVEQALKEGKPVPENVLKDYPDLAEKYKLVKVKSETKPEAELKAKIEEKYPPGKEPWRMTKEEFETNNMLKDKPHTLYHLSKAEIKGNKIVKGFASDSPLRCLINVPYAQEGTMYVLRYDPKKIIKSGPHEFAIRKPVEIVAKLPREYWRNPHKYFVEQALKEGKPVPEEVLKDYPDLVKKYKPALSEVKLYAGLPLDEVIKKGFETLNQLARITREKAAKKGLYRLADILGYGKEIRGKDIKGIKTWTAKLYNLEDIVRRYGDYYPEVKEIEYAMKWIREPQANRWAYAVDETIMKPLNKLSKESKEKVFRILYRESLTGKPDPNVKNLSSEEKNVYRRVRKFLEIVWKDIKDSYKEALKKYIDAKPMSNEEKKILTEALKKADPKVVPDELKTKHAAFYRHLVRYAEMYPVPYYMPQRRTGGFMVKLIDPKTGEVIFAHDVETSAEAKRIAEAFEKGDYSVVEKWFKELGVPFDVKSIPKNVKVVAEEISRIPVEAGAEIPFSKIIAFLHTSAERAKKLPKEDVANFYMNLAEDIDNFLKSLGWSVHLIRRKNIPGFSLKLEDAEKRLRGYLYGYGLSKAKKQAMEHAYKAFYKLVHRKGYKPEGLIRELSDYLSYAFGTPEPREVRQLNRLIVLWFLGGRVKSALINATQNLTSGLAAYIHHKIPAKQLLIGLKKVFGKKGLSLEDRRALRKAIQEGWLDANIVDEMMNQWRGMNTIVDTVMLPFRYVETYVNRATHFIGAFDYFHKVKKMPFDEAYKKAIEVMLEGHFWASRYNRAPIERKSWGRLLTALQTFTFHYFRYAFNLARKKDWKALGWLLGSPMVLGGVVALPGGELVEEHVVKPLYRKLTGKELEIDLSKHPELKYGPLGYISPSLSISVGVGLSEDPMRIYGGVAQNILRQVKRSISLWKRGNKEGAIMELMPLAIRDIYRGIKGKAGLRTTFGEVVLDEEGRPVSLTGKEAFMMALGFKPMRIQKVFDMRALEREIQRRRNEILRKFGTSFSKAETAEDKRAVLRALIEYNKKIKEKAMEAGKKGDMIYYRYWNLMYITPEEVVRWAELNKRAEKGIRKEIQAFARQIM